MYKDSKRHINIPVFIPHLGCPNNCIFCNQRLISGVNEFIPDMAEKTIEEVLGATDIAKDDVEIAFFGGSFTGIDRTLMVKLLDLAESYVASGKVSGIRMSTRPDYINDEIIEILKKYTVSAVELGIQSFSARVLEGVKRGHTVLDSENAFKLLKDGGFNVVGQMMIGLPFSSGKDECECAQKICELGASGTRIYPTLVFRGTELEKLTESGIYKPLTVEEAVMRSADVLEIFLEHNVECLRIGLCDSDNLHSEASFFVGPNHPAIGELVYSEIYKRKTEELLDACITKNETIRIAVHKGDVSMVIGQHSVNKKYFLEKYSIKKLIISERDDISRFDVRLTEE